MMTNKKHFIYITAASVYAVLAYGANAASVKRTAVARTPTATATTAVSAQATVENTNTSTPEAAEIVTTNKSSQFSSSVETSATSSATDNSFAEKIRAQRDAANAQTASTIGNAAIASSMSGTGQNACDSGLRKCMQEKCGADYTKCATDTDTSWNNKMDLCRMKTNCGGHEYSLLAPEIKADRDMNVQIASYNAIINCGNQYNNCMIGECGDTFTKCLSKKASDNATAKCARIANECKEQDSGLAARAGSIFGTLREIAGKRVAVDEQRLYTLRDQMREQCSYLGAMFDERTFDCVYTVNFFANNSETPYASKKAYAGSTFDCNQNWFGVDVTTFKENAYRLTRSQTAASSAMLGSGVGMAAGAISSGAINRAIDTKQAKNAEGKAKCEQEGGEWNQLLSKCTSKEKLEEKAAKKAEKQAEKDEKKAAKAEKKAEKQAAKEEKKALKGVKQASNPIEEAEKKGDDNLKEIRDEFAGTDTAQINKKRAEQVKKDIKNGKYLEEVNEESVEEDPETELRIKNFQDYEKMEKELDQESDNLREEIDRELNAAQNIQNTQQTAVTTDPPALEQIASRQTEHAKNMGAGVAGLDTN